MVLFTSTILLCILYWWILFVIWLLVMNLTSSLPRMEVVRVLDLWLLVASETKNSSSFGEKWEENERKIWKEKENERKTDHKFTTKKTETTNNIFLMMDRFLVNFLLPDAYCYNLHSFSPRCLSSFFDTLFLERTLYYTKYDVLTKYCQRSHMNKFVTTCITFPHLQPYRE